jgi:ABC-type amino acid transport substrate-binding protein
LNRNPNHRFLPFAEEKCMKKALPLILILFMSFAILFTGTGCAKQKETILRVGTHAEYPPFEYKQGDEFAGVDMDIVKALAQKMKLKYIIIDMDFDALIPSLTSDKIDLAISSITITEERKKRIDYSAPYYTANQVILAKTDSPLKITKIEDLRQFKIGAQNGTTGQIYVDDNLVKKNLMDKKNLRKYSRLIESVTDLLNGNIDFVIMDDSAARGYIKLKPLKIVYKIVTDEKYGIALPKNSPYKDRINAALEELIQSGEIDSILAKNKQ